MKPKLFVLFALIVLIPCGLLLWIGVSGVHNERDIVRRKISGILQGELNEIASRAAGVVNACRLHLLNATESLPLEPLQIRRWIRGEPRCSQVFVMDPAGRVVFPDTSLNSSQRERDFLERASQVWEDRQLFFRQPEDQPSVQAFNADEQGSVQAINPGGQDAGQADNVADRSQGLMQEEQAQAGTEPAQNTPRIPPPARGWYTWFWGSGIQLLFWQRRSSGHVLGIELNRSRLVADVIAALPDFFPRKWGPQGTTDFTGSHRSTARRPARSSEPQMQEQRIRLLDSTGNILYQWGRFEPGDVEAPNAVLHLPEPLEAWRFEYFLSTAGLYRSLARTRYTNLFIALVSVGLILAFLVIYFYRESSRELREAGQRVTFVNRVSHELKTPLTNVRMYGELLEREIPEGNQKAARCMYVILSESRRLSRLIGNILSFARKRRNTLKLHTKAGVVDEVLATVISHFRPALREKGVEVVFRAGAPGTVVFDHDALEQIMGNLFNNVEKYAGEGGFMEVVSSRKGAVTCITVKDRGPGVPEDQREEIFLPFHRVSNRLTDGISGTGIGLSIARELARLHGGDLVVKEGETKGACFQATLQTPESTP